MLIWIKSSAREKDLPDTPRKTYSKIAHKTNFENYKKLLEGKAACVFDIVPSLRISTHSSFWGSKARYMDGTVKE